MGSTVEQSGAETDLTMASAVAVAHLEAVA
jgi:hypothetical protein